MYSSFVVIGLLVESNIGEKCPINFLMNISITALKHLWCASVYNGTSSKKKINLTEMIVYGKMTGTLEKQYVEKEISNEEARNYWKEWYIINKHHYLGLEIWVREKRI